MKQSSQVGFVKSIPSDNRPLGIYCASKKEYRLRKNIVTPESHSSQNYILSSQQAVILSPHSKFRSQEAEIIYPHIRPRCCLHITSQILYSHNKLRSFPIFLQSGTSLPRSQQQARILIHYSGQMKKKTYYIVKNLLRLLKQHQINYFKTVHNDRVIHPV